MEIGPARRQYEIEPLEEPVPPAQAPDEQPAPAAPRREPAEPAPELVPG